MKIACLSDTHGRLPEALFERLAGCELILHLGDLGPLELLTELEAVAPTLAVMGNTDAPGQARLPVERRFERAGLLFHMRHHPWSAREAAFLGAGLFFHGHTHVRRLEPVGRGLILCPGALSRPRAAQPASLARLEVGPAALHVAFCALEDGRILEESRLPLASLHERS